MQQRTESVENTCPSEDAATDTAPDGAGDVVGAAPGDAGSAGSEEDPKSASSDADQALSTAGAVTEPSDAATAAGSNSGAPGEPDPPDEPLTAKPIPDPDATESQATGTKATGTKASGTQATGTQTTRSQTTGPEAARPATTDTPTARFADTDATEHLAAAGAEQATLPAAGPQAAEPGPTAAEDTTAPAAPVEPAAAADVVEFDPGPARPGPAPVPVPPDAASERRDARQERYRDLPDHERIVPVQTRTAPAKSSAGVARWGRRVLIMALTLALMGLIPVLLARLYLIPSGSMEKTLHGCKGCDNDRVLVDRLVYRFSDPQPGEIVVFNAGPDLWTNSEVQNPGTVNPIVRAFEQFGAHVGISPPAGSDFAKRVIAVGGQTVMCCDRRNRITIDDKPIDEPYLYFDPSAGSAIQKGFPKVTVPLGKIFVMGDNRNGSLDSRAPGNGPVPVSAVAGKVRLIVTPFDRFGRLDDTNPQKPPQ